MFFSRRLYACNGFWRIYDLKSKTKIHEWDHKDQRMFSPDGSMLATGDTANKTTIYDLKSKTKIHEWDHKGYVNSVCFSPLCLQRVRASKMIERQWHSTGDGAKTTIYDLKSKTWQLDPRIRRTKAFLLCHSFFLVLARASCSLLRDKRIRATALLRRQGRGPDGRSSATLFFHFQILFGSVAFVKAP